MCVDRYACLFEFSPAKCIRGDMTCKRCGQPLKGKQTSYCSPRCSKLHLKSLYRKRNPQKAKEWKENSYGKGSGYPISTKYRAKTRNLLGNMCLRCGTSDCLNIHHIKPPKHGGTNDLWNLAVLCFDCHQLLHQMLDHDAYWGGYANSNNDPQ